MSRKIKKTKLTTEQPAANLTTEVEVQTPRSALAGMGGDEHRIYSSMFEVFGIVQGVFFRKAKAKQLGLGGWCMNTREGTVKGVIEGKLLGLNEMKTWLQTKGSPRSTITKAVFTPNEPLPAHNFKTFTIRR